MKLDSESDLKLIWTPPLSRCARPVEMFTHRRKTSEKLKKLTGSWEMISGCFFNN